MKCSNTIAQLHEHRKRNPFHLNSLHCEDICNYQPSSNIIISYDVLGQTAVPFDFTFTFCLLRLRLVWSKQNWIFWKEKKCVSAQNTMEIVVEKLVFISFCIFKN